jgi:hypothetical protein
MEGEDEWYHGGSRYQDFDTYLARWFAVRKVRGAVWVKSETEVKVK